MEYLQYLEKMQSYFNDILSVPVEYVKNKLSVDTQKLPTFLQTPLNFTMFFSSMFYFIVANADTFICNMIGITYPIMYCVHLLNTTPLPVDKVVIINKYWILFGSFILLDPIFGYIPFYYYLKLISIYLLVRNDFSMTTYVFGYFEAQYMRLDELLKNYDGKMLWYKLFPNEETKIDDNKKIN
jgi:hypothetical protein